MTTQPAWPSQSLQAGAAEHPATADSLHQSQVTTQPGAAWQQPLRWPDGAGAEKGAAPLAAQEESNFDSPGAAAAAGPQPSQADSCDGCAARGAGLLRPDADAAAAHQRAAPGDALSQRAPPPPPPGR